MKTILIVLMFLNILLDIKYPLTIYIPYIPPKKLISNKFPYCSNLNVYNIIFIVGNIKVKINTIIIGIFKDFKLKVCTILLKYGIAIYIPIIIGIYHIFLNGTFSTKNISFINIYISKFWLLYITINTL